LIVKPLGVAIVWDIELSNEVTGVLGSGTIEVIVGLEMGILESEFVLVGVPVFWLNP